MRKTLLEWALIVTLPSTSLIAADRLFPEKTIQDFLSTYNEQERTDIELDLQNIRTLIFKKTKKDNPLYVATAGGPLSRKSTTLESYIKKDQRFSELAYIDPDARSLFFMINTYHAQSLNYGTISQYEFFADAKRDAYNKWRWGSNYIAHTLLDEAFSKRIGIAHGTTATSPGVVHLFEKLKKAGYRIELILCDSDHKSKEIALHERNHVQYNYQTTPEDLVNKAIMFYERMPAYFQFADRLYIHYTENLKEDYQSAAVINIDKKEISITNPTKYQKFVSAYDSKLRSGAPSWIELVASFVSKSS